MLRHHHELPGRFENRMRTQSEHRIQTLSWERPDTLYYLPQVRMPTHTHILFLSAHTHSLSLSVPTHLNDKMQNSLWRSDTRTYSSDYILTSYFPHECFGNQQHSNVCRSLGRMIRNCSTISNNANAAALYNAECMLSSACEPSLGDHTHTYIKHTDLRHAYTSCKVITHTLFS